MYGLYSLQEKGHIDILWPWPLYELHRRGFLKEVPVDGERE